MSQAIALMQASTLNVSGTFSDSTVSSACSSDSESRLSNINEYGALFINKDIVSLTSTIYTSSSIYDADRVWKLAGDDGYVVAAEKGLSTSTVRCIKR